MHTSARHVAELSKVWRFEDIENDIDNPPKPTLINDYFPKDEARYAATRAASDIIAIAHYVAHFK